MTVETRLAAIRARIENATPGPWENDGGGEVGQHWSRPGPCLPVISTEVSCGSYCYGGSARGVEEDADAEFIAHSRTDLPALLAAVQAVVGLASKWDHHTDAGEDEHACTCHGCQVRQVITDALGGAA